MKKALLLLILLFQFNLVRSQLCEIRAYYDEMEAFNWVGDWWVGTTAGFSTNASVTPTLSAVFYGVGSGSSVYENDWYSLPNVIGLNPFSTYVFRFRLASYRFTSTSTTRGVDIGDYVTVQLSTNGGVTYVNELRITGNNNAFWNYSSTATASKVANGTLTVLSPTGGGDRTSTGDGYSFIELILPSGTTQCAIDIFCRANSAGEEWWIDNVELIERFSCDPLPIELLAFTATPNDNRTVDINWQTATESNNNYFIIENSVNGFDWHEIARVNGAGNSNQVLNYHHVDPSPFSGVSYYRLTQVDFNGEYEIFDAKAVVLDEPEKCDLEARYYDLTGRQVAFDKLTRGALYLKVCGDNIEKIVISY